LQFDEELDEKIDRDAGDMTISDEVVNANIAAFRARAAKYDNENSQLIARVVATKILQFEFDDGPSTRETPAEFAANDYDFNSHDISGVVESLWDPEFTRVLDFACGTGLVSQNLAPYTKQIVGIDISPDMVQVFNTKVYNQGISPDEMQSHVGDLLGDKELDLGKFDAAVSSLGYHHIHDIDLATSRLAHCLDPGGRLYVVDIEHGSGSVHGSMTDEEALKQGVAHRGGLEADHIAGAFRKAGLERITVTKAFRVKLWVPSEQAKTYSGLTGATKEVNGQVLHCAKVNLILVTGRKPATDE
jgi:SAM-dependent methyltransferase